MNRTQKSAWFNLVIAAFCIAIFAYAFISLGILKQPPNRIAGAYLPLALFAATIISSIFFLKKQSLKEPESDERDNIIKLRAVLVSFVAVFVLLLVKTVILYLFLGVGGTIYICFLPLIDLTLLFIILLVHSIAIIAQYGIRVKNG